MLFWIMNIAIFSFPPETCVPNPWLNFENMFQGAKQKIFKSDLTLSVIWIEATDLHGRSHRPPLPRSHYTFGMQKTKRWEPEYTQSQKIKKRVGGLFSKLIKALEPFVGSDG